MERELTLSRTDWRGVQQRLKDLRFYFGEVDGLRGPLTDNAIIAFKRSVGLRARPFFGALTFDMLMAAPRPESPWPWLDIAVEMLGAHERRDTAKLRAWFDKIVPDWVKPDEVSWCGAFVGTCLRKWDPEQEMPGNILGARQWGNYGEKCPPQKGAVLTFWRGSKSGWQGHVGFMVGQDATAYHVLGGNQSDAVTITRIAKSRLLQSRWPKATSQPMQMAWGDIGTTLSTNEA